MRVSGPLGMIAGWVLFAIAMLWNCKQDNQIAALPRAVQAITFPAPAESPQPGVHADFEQQIVRADAEPGQC